MPLGLLRRRMRFGSVVAAELIAFTLAGAAAVALAYAGAGAWALIAQLILQQVGVAAAVLVLCRLALGWRPAGLSRSTPAAELGEFITFGWQSTGSRLALNFGRLFDFFMLGRFASPAALGLYERAWTWASFPARQVQKPLVYVAVSWLSDGHRRLERARTEDGDVDAALHRVPAVGGAGAGAAAVGRAAGAGAAERRGRGGRAGAARARTGSRPRRS